MKVKCKTTAHGLSLMALSALTLMSVAQADYNSSRGHDERRGHNETKAMQQDQVIMPAAGPRVNNGADLFVSADFIYWRMTQDGSSFAFSGVNGLNQSPLQDYADVPPGQIYSSGNDWAPGFKVGIGLDTSHDGWDVYAEYTWVRFSNSESVSLSSVANGDFTWNPLFQIPVTPINPIQDQIFGLDGLPQGNSATGSTTLQYNKINLELGRNFYFSQYLTARPHAGITGVWLNNHIRNTLTDRTTGANEISWGGDALSYDDPLYSTDVQPFTQVSNSRSSNWGLGARAGFDFGWHFDKEWSIYSAFTGNAIWNRFSSNTFTLAVQGSAFGADNPAILDGTPVNKPIITFSQDSGISRVNYVVEAELGLCWETFFYDDNYHFAAKLGWEMQDWINYISVSNGQSFTDSNLMLHGLNVQLRFDF